MSGIGRYYRRQWRRQDGSVVESKHYSISFPFQGRTRIEATQAETESQAKAALKRKLEEIGRGSYTPNQDRITLDVLIDHLKAKYRDDNKRSLQTALDKLKPVLDFFGGMRITWITVQKINAYKALRLSEPKADGTLRTRATINGELRYLRRLFSIGIESELITHAPVIELLEGENKRDGFVDPGDFETLLSKFEDRDVADMVEFLYVTGWRVRAARLLTWNLVNSERSTVTMTALLSKNKTPLELPLNAKLRVLLERRKTKRRLDCPYVFHRNGKPILNFKKNWHEATGQAKLTGLMVHDLCRSAARNLSRAGIHETVASRYLNRKTLNIYKQYRIVDQDDLKNAGDALEQYLNTSNKKILMLDESKRNTQ